MLMLDLREQKKINATEYHLFFIQVKWSTKRVIWVIIVKGKMARL
jgi:hypothetical protein